MTIQEAIEKAIEGGYPKWREDSEEPCFECGGNILLDPLFWQSLGKAKRWSGTWFYPPLTQSIGVEGWEYHWHMFIDHLIQGGTPEDFFKQL